MQEQPPAPFGHEHAAAGQKAERPGLGETGDHAGDGDGACARVECVGGQRQQKGQEGGEADHRVTPLLWR